MSKGFAQSSYAVTISGEEDRTRSVRVALCVLIRSVSKGSSAKTESADGGYWISNLIKVSLKPRMKLHKQLSRTKRGKDGDILSRMNGYRERDRSKV